MKAKPFGELTSLDEALALALQAAEPVEGTEEVALEDASGRVVAERVLADLDVPPFDRAAMDGYALKARDTAQAPVTLRCVGEVFAGERPRVAVEPGTCVAIATGAILPEGADAVVMVEQTEARGEMVQIASPVREGQNVACRGEDIRAGEVLLEEGSLLNPAKLGALAALGRTRIRVYARPRAVVLPTGTEVVAPGSGPLEPGQIYDINTTTLLAFLKEFGAEAQAHPGVADEIDALRQAVSSLTEPELLILTGGSSVGERDLLAEVFSEVGEILFHGIAVKPGKPTLMARRKEGGQLLLGMPGYPTSCLSNAYILLGPIVAHVGRRPAPRLKIVEVPLAEPVKSTPDRFQVLTVTLSGGQAYPAFKTSSAITSMSQADGYIEIPQGCAGLEAGSTVLVKLF